jgi:hypothetical protein
MIPSEATRGLVLPRRRSNRPAGVSGSVQFACPCVKLNCKAFELFLSVGIGARTRRGTAAGRKHAKIVCCHCGVPLNTRHHPKNQFSANHRRPVAPRVDLGRAAAAVASLARLTAMVGHPLTCDVAHSDHWLLTGMLIRFFDEGRNVVLRRLSPLSAGAGVGSSQKDDLRCLRCSTRLLRTRSSISTSWWGSSVGRRSCPAGRREAGASDFPPLTTV